jgi:hypothetical protein
MESELQAPTEQIQFLKTGLAAVASHISQSQDTIKTASFSAEAGENGYRTNLSTCTTTDFPKLYHMVANINKAMEEIHQLEIWLSERNIS